MSYEVLISNSARKDFKRIPKKFQNRIKSALFLLKKVSYKKGTEERCKKKFKEQIIRVCID